MNLIKIFSIIILVVALVLSNVAAFPFKEGEYQEDYGNGFTSIAKQFSFGNQKKTRRHGRLTCNKFPRVCRAKGSPGPHCCKKKCVNVLTDRMNCGACGKKCKYNQVCCNGKCVNPFFNRKHCGGCNNACKNGGFCAFGLCNYA